MNRIFATSSQLAERIAERPPTYAAELEPAIIERTSEGLWIDADHPAFVEMKIRYGSVPQVADGAGWLEKWTAFHRRPFDASDPPDLQAEANWLDAFLAGLPCGGCRSDAEARLAAAPLDLSSREAYFASGVAFHDGINRKLGKPEFGLQAARLRWIPGVIEAA